MFEVGSNWYIRGDLGVSFDEAPTVSLSSISTPPPGAHRHPVHDVSRNELVDHQLHRRPRSRLSLQRLSALGRDLGLPHRRRGNPQHGARLPPIPDDWSRRLDDRPARGQPLQHLGHLQRDDEAQAVQQRLPRQRLCRSRNLRRLHPLCRRRPGPQHERRNGKLQRLPNERRSGLCAEPHASRGFPQVWVNQQGQPISPQPAVAFGQQYWSRSISSTTYSFAWALSAGLGFQLNPSTTLDIGYRYLNSGVTTRLINPQTGLTLRQNNASQQLRVGIRYVLQ